MTTLTLFLPAGADPAEAAARLAGVRQALPAGVELQPLAMAPAEQVAAYEAALPGAQVVAADAEVDYPGQARNLALARAEGELLLVCEPQEEVLALAPQLEALAADAELAAAYGQTQTLGDPERGDPERVYPEAGREGDVLANLVRTRHLIASAACAVWRRAALGQRPFGALATAPALRLSLALHVASPTRAAPGGRFAFAQQVVARRPSEQLGPEEREELCKVFLGVLYAPDTPEPKVEQRARRRLARHMVALGKHHYREGRHKRAAAFLDEAVKAAPGYFRGRRYQFLNFLKRMVKR